MERVSAFHLFHAYPMVLAYLHLILKNFNRFFRGEKIPLWIVYIFLTCGLYLLHVRIQSDIRTNNYFRYLWYGLPYYMLLQTNDAAWTRTLCNTSQLLSIRLFNNLCPVLFFIIEYTYASKYYPSLALLCACLIKSLITFQPVGLRLSISWQSYAIFIHSCARKYIHLLLMGLSVFVFTKAYGVRNNTLILTAPSISFIYFIESALFTEPLYYIWMHAQSSKQFLQYQVLTFVKLFLIHSIPWLVIFAIYDWKQCIYFFILMTGIFIGVLMMMFSKYAYYPSKTSSFIAQIIVAFSLTITLNPTLSVLALLPLAYWLVKSNSNLKQILQK